MAVHWGINPGDENYNAKPFGILGWKVQYALGGPSVNESGWKEVEAESKVNHFTLHASHFILASGRWVDRNLRVGPPGDYAACTVRP